MPGTGSVRGWTLILKLRSNIALEGDLRLAELEIAGLLGCKPAPLHRPALNSFVAGGMLLPDDLHYSRANGIVAYLVYVDTLDLSRLFRRLSFVELVLGRASCPQERRGEGMQMFKEVPAPFIRFEFGDDKVRFRLVPFNTAAEWSDVIARRAANPTEAVRAMEQTLAVALEGKMPGRKDALLQRAMSAKVTTGHFFHGLHVYKAKFFPRMVRALLNVYAPGPHAFVLDPYVGSGTALTEAWVMGMPSAGVDIDPLSVLIANAKIHLLRTKGEAALASALDVKTRLSTLRTGQLPLFQIHEERTPYAAIIPPFLTRRVPAETQEEVVKDIGLALSAIGWLDDGAALPFRVALSDAISRKFKFRFLGLGYGRFSLNIRPGRIVEMFSSNLDYLAKSVAAWQWLRQAANLAPVPSGVQLGDARSLPYSDSAFDFIITSPPYMPASSGRENYLKSKALAMTALGLIRADEVDVYEQRQVGSVHRSDGLEGLPPKAREAVEWMACDEVRQVKAAATASYFADLAQSLAEIRRVLRPGGRCAMVIARQHTFYRYRSRDVVRVIDNAEIVSELAEMGGLEIADALHVELNKQNAVARPRALDAYYETVLILEKRMRAKVTRGAGFLACQQPGKAAPRAAFATMRKNLEESL